MRKPAEERGNCYQAGVIRFRSPENVAGSLAAFAIVAATALPAYGQEGAGARNAGPERLASPIDSPELLALSPDAGRLAVADAGNVAVVDLQTGDAVDSLAGDCCISGMAWVGEQDVLIARDSGTGADAAGPGLDLYRPGVYQPPSRLSSAPCTAVSAAGSLAAAACGDGLVLVGVEDGAGSVVAYGGLGFFQDIAITPDGSMVIAAHRDVAGLAAGESIAPESIAGDPATALFLDVAADWPVDPPAAYGEMVLDANIRYLAPAPDGAVATLADGSVAELSTDGISVIHDVALRDDAGPLVVLPEGRYAVGDFQNGSVLDLATGEISAMPNGDSAPTMDGVARGAWAAAAGPTVAWAGPDPANGAVILIWRNLVLE
ncbi:hypothetical protein [Fodinicurvata sp. EGI_FJ10296]|uniref:hypothetical protein n=1 Tax=Fodinicurvata sp. EGI_FJ10296 TaxID=3231908 RepID=UPI00345561BC